jgi:formylglycine-generating enzyme required for sulfatase activity
MQVLLISKVMDVRGMRCAVGLLIVAGAVMGYAQDLVRVPESTQEVTDQITAVKVQTRVSDFLLGATEVTQKEYEAITGSNPSVYKGRERPVENVSWWDAIRHCNLRSTKEGLPQCYDLQTGRRHPSCTGYRLPTEAEWIAAAGPMPPGAQLIETGVFGVSSTKSLLDLNERLKRGTAPVRSRKANPLGFYDLRGNVWEWCGDYFDAIASPNSVRDPSGPATGLERVIRGGSFISSTSRWSREFRSSVKPDYRSRFTGFRVARSVADFKQQDSAGDDFSGPTTR